MLTYRVLSRIDEINVLKDGWDDLVDSEYSGNPFLTSDWNLNWLRHFSSQDTSIRYIVVVERLEIKGIFPMIIRKERFHGLQLRVLSYAGNLYSPMQCPVLRKESATAVISYFSQNILPNLDWDVAILRGLCEEHPGLRELCAAVSQDGYISVVTPSVGNWVLDGRGMSVDAYYQSLKPNLRNDTKRMPKRMAEVGAMCFRLLSGAIEESDIDAYRQVYSRSWKEPELDAEFHPDLMRLAASRGWLRLGFLDLDGRPIAAQFWLYRNAIGYILKTAYDESYKQYSPGTVLTWKIIDHLMRQEGMSCFDYLKGDDSYKKNWTNIRRQRFDMIIFGKTSLGLLGRVLDQDILPLVRNNPLLSRVKKALISRGKTI